MSNKSEPGPSSFIKKLLNNINLFSASSKSRKVEESVSQIVRDKELLNEAHEEEKNILRNLVHFGNLQTCDVMINRSEIISTNIETSFAELKKLFIKESHSRIPIYKETVDDIVGFIHVKDVLKASQRGSKTSIKNLIRTILYVPESMKLADLLSMMKKTQIHIAIVLDEYGGSIGLLSIEDVVEALVGDIHDEHDEKEQKETVIEDKGLFFIDASAEIKDVEKKLKISFSEDDEDPDFETFGGFVIHYLGYIPEIGTKFLWHNYEIEVTDGTNRKLLKLTIKKINKK